MNGLHKYDMIDEYEETYQEDMELLNSVHSISLGDLMGEDHDIWIQKNKTFGFDLEIDDENSQPILKEESIHPAAIESLALFCNRFLRTYARYCDNGEHNDYA